MLLRVDVMYEGVVFLLIGEGFGVNDILVILLILVGGNVKSWDWRVYMLNGGEFDMDLSLSLEKVSDIGIYLEYQKEMFGFSEVICDEESLFMVEEGILEQDGGNLVDDYKFWVYIFEESVVFFFVLKD